MKRTVILVTVVLAGLLVIPALGQGFGIGFRVGTTGLGGEVAYNLTPKLNVRGHFSTFTYSIDETGGDEPEMHATGDAQTGAIMAFVDFHPFNNTFRLTAGLGKSTLDISGSAIPTESVCFGDEDAQGVCDGKVFLPDRLGKLTGSITYPSSVHPYAGIGFGNLARGSSRITFLFDLGVIYTGAPELELGNDGLFKPTTAPENVQSINDGIESFAWYPVLSLGFGIRL